MRNERIPWLTRHPAVACGTPEGPTRPVRGAVSAGGQGFWHPTRSGVFERVHFGHVAQGQTDVVEAFHEPPTGVVVDLQGHRELTADGGPGPEVDGHLGAG